MDKSWIHELRDSAAYQNGVLKFLEYATIHGATNNGKMRCPCRSCYNAKYHTVHDVYDHLICKGFLSSYTCWIFHGESSSSTYISSNENMASEISPHEDVDALLNDVYGISQPTINMDDPTSTCQQPNEGHDRFCRLVKDAEQELYPGCKRFNKLSFLVRLLHLKCLNGWSQKSFDMVLELFKEALPEGVTLPKDFNQAKRLLKEVGLSYNKIHACPNNCMLFWKKSIGLDRCVKCNASRWKDDRKIPAKVLRHFPLIPRLQRFFMSAQIASEMRWHEEERTKDGLVRHPADSLAWKSFDSKNPPFASDPRNVRLGLASDGFNPFKMMNVSHSTWPVVLLPYNLPPWMCMKQPNIILVLLIDGPSSPGNDIDVYLEPLIDELKELWEVGVQTYDAAKKETFQMRAALLWTISDFPGYAMLSGWSTKGRFACPCCHKDTCSQFLKHGRKHCYMGHRRFLEPNHQFRGDKRSFDGTEELRPPPIPLSGDDVLHMLNGFHFSLGKNERSSFGCRRRNDDGQQFYNWKKKSIFFNLSYWKDNLLRHNLDVMHIEKNVCQNVIGTLLNVQGKTKDNFNARYDLKEMNIREALHPQEGVGTNRIYLPPACFSMNKEEKGIFYKVLKNVKVPDGYAANISRCIGDNKIFGMKSHDYHILMQQFLPLAVRKTLPKTVGSVLIDLSKFFKELCTKVLREEDLISLEQDIIVTLCHLERIFPPAFFDIMIHLIIHLSTEARLGGPVQYRWMYPIERYLLTLKNYVRNRSQPEGSIAQGYLAEECLTFCSRYLSGVETRFNRPVRNDDNGGGHFLGKVEVFQMDDVTMKQAHRYVLFNHDLVNPYLEKHVDFLRMRRGRGQRPHDIERMHSEQFPTWFEARVELDSHSGHIEEELIHLSRGPHSMARKFKGYVINGFRFHTRDREKNLKTQNSGVFVTGKTSSFASSRDRNPITGDVTYYGVITDIIEICYSNKVRFVLFKCDWVDVWNRGRGVRTEEFSKCTLVNFNRLLSSAQHEPFVLASQVEQVFYVQDPIDEDWHVVIKNKPRDLFEVDSKLTYDDVELYWDNLSAAENSNLSIGHGNDNMNWVRDGMHGEEIDLQDMHDEERDDSDIDEGN